MFSAYPPNFFVHKLTAKIIDQLFPIESLYSPLPRDLKTSKELSRRKRTGYYTL
jgi:hypothetical protein